MAQETTDYMNDPAVGPHSPNMMIAEMGLWMGSQWGSGLAKRAFTKHGVWKGSTAATNAYYNSMRKGATMWGAFGARGSISSATQAGKYANALSIIRAKGGGMFSFRTAKAAANLGIGKQFAMLSASGLSKSIFTGLNVSMWAPLLFEGTMGAITTLRSIGRKGPRQEFGERFFDTQATYTERQRSVRAITSSRLSARSAIGNEAQLLHR